MPGIVENLSAFNRKERFFLVGMALGNPEFKLCEQFRNKVGEALHISIPEDAFAAMDYHLDWIYASLLLASDKTKAQVFLNTEELVTATQEDIDFLIAYQDGNACHMVFLEAKGVMGFTNRQLQSKVGRLRNIFGDGGNNYPGVIPHFAIVSPKRPIRIRTSEWPTWIKPNSEIPWIKMSIPAGLRRITRCDETGKASAKGKWWRTISYPSLMGGIRYATP